MIRLAQATTPRPCYTSHAYSLVLQSVTVDSVALDDLSKYDGFTLFLETGPPDMFELEVDHPDLKGWIDQSFQVPHRLN
jgi:hypothetical protein